MSGHDAMVDPDCPSCQMLADMPGPTFWHLDGCNMDNEFAFDIYRRTREEWEAVKLAGSHLFTQELMQEILANESKTDLLVIYDHKGARSMDAAAYFVGHGFENAKSVRGGIDAWSQEVDPKLPRYDLESA